MKAGMRKWLRALPLSLLLLAALGRCGGTAPAPASPADASSTTAPATSAPGASSSAVTNSSQGSGPSTLEPAVSKTPSFIEDMGPGALGQVIQKSRPLFRACFNELLKRKPESSGHLIVALWVKPNGALKSFEIVKEGSSIDDDTMNACVKSTMGTLHFPSSREGKEHYTKYDFGFALHSDPNSSP